jgi:hypothetical protein
VVFFLIQNVLSHLLHTRRADAERAVTGLPGKIVELRALPLHPLRGFGFNLLDQTRNRHVLVQEAQGMNMVDMPAHDLTRALLAVQCSGDVRKECGLNLLCQPGFTALGAKNDVKEVSDEGLRHYYLALSGLGLLRLVNPGRRSLRSLGLGYEIPALRA